MEGILRNRFNNCRAATLEAQAQNEAERLFAEYLKLFPVSREAVELLERNLLKLARAAKMAASKPAKNVIQIDAGVAWHRDVDLLDNIFLCHRPMSERTEYAVVEYFPANGTNEIWNQGWDAVQVLNTFAKEQRQALDLGTEDMVTHITEFLAEKYSGQDLSYLSDRYRHHFNDATSSWPRQSHEQNQSVVSMAKRIDK
jgi:hypothetical protein